MRKICVVTGSRAEYGLLYWILREIEKSPSLKLQLVVTGMHLSSEFGMTVQEIEKDGFEIAHSVEMLLSSDSSVGVSKSVGLGIAGFADAFENLKPDLVLVLGDRFEILSGVISAFIAAIPVAHIHGGEVTEGAFDDGIRHSITKMSSLHFASAEEYRNRILQLGENPTHVFNVGAPGVEHIERLEFMDKGFSTAVKKLGTIGCTVKIMRPGVRLPHEIMITERSDSGLPPLSEVAMFETSVDDMSEDVESEETPAPEADEVVDSVIEKIADIESKEEE